MSVNESRYRRYYWKRVHEGVCPKCNKRPMLEDKRSCAECLVETNAKSNARYRTARAAGKCGYCYHRKAMAHRSYCFQCHVKVTKRRHAALKAKELTP